MLFGESECKRCCMLYGKSLCKLLESQICVQKFTVDAQSVRGCLAGDSKSAAIRKKVGRCFGTGAEYQSPLPLPLQSPPAQPLNGHCSWVLLLKQCHELAQKSPATARRAG